MNVSKKIFKNLNEMRRCDSVEYYLPFDTKEQPPLLLQGFDGPWSHRQISTSEQSYKCSIDLTHSTDWALNPGTLVRATRDGVAYALFDKSGDYYEGIDPNVGVPFALRNNTNLLILKHKDGASSFYSHLEKGGIRVAKNQLIRRGDVIATTGKSGWVGPVPHLHFHIMTPETSSNSTPFRFVDCPGSLYHRDIPRSVSEEIQRKITTKICI